MFGQGYCKYKPPAINLTYFKNSSTALKMKQLQYCRSLFSLTKICVRCIKKQII